MAKKILFVCTGNTCRSAMAAYLGAAIAQKHFPQNEYLFDSAGLMAGENVPASAESVSVLADRCIDLKNHRSKCFREEMVEKSDIIVVMTKSHKQFLLEKFPQAMGKAYTLGELSGSNMDVADPYCGSYDLYVKTANILDEEIMKMFENMEKTEDK
ncbi:MAG: low molecular weight protein arginine phosphatase [Clostridiales bacterium]